MDRSLKWRTIGLLFGVLLCVGLLAPTWPGSSSLPSWFPFKKKISLGLDLQGGMHIVYAIDLDRAVDDKASEIKRDLEARFADEKLDAKVKAPQPSPPKDNDPGIPLGAVTVTLPDDAKIAEVKAQIHSDNGDTIQDRECAKSDGAHAICFRVSASFANGLERSALANAVNTIRERINEKGVAEPSVVEKGENVIVELPGDPDDPVMQETREIIARTAKLEFKVVDDGSEYMSKLFKHVGNQGKEDAPTDPEAAKLDIKAKIDQWRPEEGGGNHIDYFLEAFDRDESVPVAWAKKHGCFNRDSIVEDDKTRCRITGRQAIERYLNGDPLLGVKGVTETVPELKLPDDHQMGYEAVEPDPGGKERRTYWRTYYLDRAVRLTGSGVSNAAPSNDPNTGRPIVLLDFNRFGGRLFGDLTSQIVGKKLATILDDKVKSAPIINGAIRGGRAAITMGGSDVLRQEREREELVNVLKTGSLPAPLREESAQKVGPTLGRDAIDKTKVSFIIGIILVILIMVGIYRWSGWIAVFAVVFHIVMTLAVMAAFGATLTLPGVAAIVLSIGMEVDGNILIYERIRDELLLGKSVRGAIDLGFSRAFSAIFDGQLTTAAAGWVLLSYGSGPIKGFAVMLLVGVFTTLSTNIWVTRIFFDWYVSRKKGQLATISI
ncbi:MAG TPA: protein translocase subunit SecD [Kofleriaceae bacterium]|nr:protein translocase subunit SecD [Kofleriaceae bacterium]